MAKQEAATPLVPSVEVQQVPSEFERLLQRDVPVRDGVFKPDSLEGYQRLARMYMGAGMVPKGLAGANDRETLARVTTCLEAGAALGLSCPQSLASLMVVNNRASVWGDAIPALIRRGGSCAAIDESWEGAGENLVAVCKITRMNPMPDGTFREETVVRRFGVGTAKVAGLWKKGGPWSSYPDRMLQVRARAWAARDAFPDLLMGMGIVEEQQDIPSDALTKAREITAGLRATSPTIDPPASEPGASPDTPSGEAGHGEPTSPDSEAFAREIGSLMDSKGMNQ